MASSFWYHNNFDYDNKNIFFRLLLLLSYLNMVDALLTVIGVSKIFSFKEVNPVFYGMSGVGVLVFIFVKMFFSFFILFVAYDTDKNFYGVKHWIRALNHYLGLFVVCAYLLIISSNFVQLLLSIFFIFR